MSNTQSTTPIYSASAARQRARQARERGAGVQERLLTLIGQLADRVIDNLPTQERIDQLSDKGYGSIKVYQAHPPKKVRETIEGEEVEVPKWPADETHFAGYKGKELEAEEPTDHSVGGIPLVAFMQGFRKAGAKAADPKTLPKGKVLADWLNERLLVGVEDPEDAMCMQTVWNGKHQQVELHLVWDLGAWNKWRDQVERAQRERREQRQKERQQGPTRSMDQYLAEREAQQADSEFTKVKSRRRAARAPEEAAAAAEDEP